MRRCTPLILLWLAGCLPVTSPSEDVALATSISSPVFKSGDAVTIRITATNHGSKVRTLTGTACQNSFSVVNAANQKVAPPGGVCTAEAVSIALRFNETYVYVHTWKGESIESDGVTVKYLDPATYRLRGKVVIDGQALASPEAIVRITP